MAQHFLLSAASRTTSLRAIYKAGENAAYQTFCEMRWPETHGEAVCPQCSHDEAYKITTRGKFKCKACAHRRNTCTSMQTTPHGWKTTAAPTTEHWRTSSCLTQWAHLCRVAGKGIGSGRLDLVHILLRQLDVTQNLASLHRLKEANRVKKKRTGVETCAL